nr:MAPEG family protein [Novosphingobium sp. SG720]
MEAPMLAPAAVLVLWSLVMLGWLGVARIQAFARTSGKLHDLPPGSRGQELESRLPPGACWPSHNYAHLMEQPTLFYAVCLILAVLGPQRDDILVAWAYVLLRVIHSLWQARINTIPARLALFGAATFCLVALAIRAAVLALRID